MREINIDWIEKMEDGLVKKNPSTKMHLVDGLEATIESLKNQIANAGKVDSVNGKQGDITLTGSDIMVSMSWSESISDVIWDIHSNRVESINGKTGKLTVDAYSIPVNSNSPSWTLNDELTRKAGVYEMSKIETKVSEVEFSELSSTATGKDGDTYTNVEWKNKNGKVYATSTLIDDILTVVYKEDNKTIRWRISFDEDGFPYKKELI